MQYIFESKMFKRSLHKDKILAAMSNPINQPLVKQLNSYFDEDSVVEPEVKLEDVEDIKVSHESVDNNIETTPEFKDEKSVLVTKSQKESNIDDDLQTEPVEDDEKDDENSEESNEDVSSSSILSSTFVTIDQVSQVVNELPGLLNLKSETAGVTHSILKGGTTNEIWVYYNPDIDINTVLESVTTYLNRPEYCFLEFNRVDRPGNAIVFSVNWVSNYFKPVSIEEDNA